MGKVTNLNEFREQKKRKKIVRKTIFLVVLFCLTVGGTYIFTSYTPSQLAGIIGDFFVGDRGKGFPIESPVVNARGLYDQNGSLLVASDSYLYEYNLTGKKSAQIKHDFISPAIETDGKFTLLYDRLTNRYNIYKNNEAFKTKKLDNPIFSADINKNGEIAVATSSKKYQSVVTVEEREFVWNSSTKIINKVELDNNSNYLCASGIETSKGQLISTVTLLDTTKTKVVFEVQLPNQIVLDISFKSGGIEVVTDQQGLLFSEKGHQIKEFSFENKPLKFFDFSSDRSLFAYGDFDKQGSIDLCVLSGNYKVIGNLKLKENIVEAKMTDKFVVILTNSSVEIFDHSFGHHKTIIAKDVYKMQPIGNSLYLISKNEISKVQLSL